AVATAQDQAGQGTRDTGMVPGLDEQPNQQHSPRVGEGLAQEARAGIAQPHGQGNPRQQQQQHGEAPGKGRPEAEYASDQGYARRKVVGEKRGGPATPSRQGG